MTAYLVCIGADAMGCAWPGDAENDRNKALTEGRERTGNRWRDERWALDPFCQVCGQRRGREEVGLFA